MAGKLTSYTLNSVKQCLSLSGVDGFHALWKEGFVIINECLISLRLFHILLVIFPKFLKPNRNFTLEMDSDVHDDFTGPH